MPLLFIIVTDAISEFISREVPWDMLYADDLIVAEESSAKFQERFGEWQKALKCMSRIIANFVLKFPNFRYHGNMGHHGMLW